MNLIFIYFCFLKFLEIFIDLIQKPKFLYNFGPKFRIMSEKLIEAPPNKVVIESPEAEVDFDQLNDQSKKIDFSYDKQVVTSFLHLLLIIIKNFRFLKILTRSQK